MAFLIKEIMKKYICIKEFWTHDYQLQGLIYNIGYIVDAITENGFIITTDDIEIDTAHFMLLSEYREKKIDSLL